MLQVNVGVCCSENNEHFEIGRKYLIQLKIKGEC